MTRPSLDRAGILRELDSIVRHCLHVGRSQKPWKAYKVVEATREFLRATRGSLSEIELLADEWESGMAEWEAAPWEGKE